MKILKKITKYDFLSDIHPIRFFGKTQYKTFLGGFISILFGLFSLLVFIYYCIIFKNRSDCRILYDNPKEYLPKSIHLTPETEMSIAISLNNTIINMPEAFNISIIYIRMNHSNGLINYTNIPINKCPNNSFNELEYDYMNFSTMMCPVFNDNFQLSHSLGKESKMVRVTVDICKNQPTCLSYDQLKDLFSFSRPKLNIFYKETSAQLVQEDALYEYINHQTIPLSLNFYKGIDIEFSEVEVVIDNGYLIRDDSYNKYYTMEEYKISEFDYINFSSKNLMEINFLPSKNNMFFKRSFMKFSEFLDYCGSVILLIYFLLSICSKYINNYYFLKEMVDRMFDSTENLKLDENFYRFTNILVEQYPNPSSKKKVESEDGDVSNDNGDYSEISFNLGNGLGKNGKKFPVECKINGIQSSTIKDNVSDCNLNHKSTYEKDLAGSRFIEIKKSMKAKPFKMVKEVKQSTYMKSDDGNLINNIEREKMNLKYSNDFLFKYTSLRERLQMEDMKKVVDNWDLIKIVLCPCLKFLSKEARLKNRIFSEASDKLNVLIDISILTKKIIEVDALKYLLLDEDQRSIFKFIAKPDISLKSTKFSGYFNTENFEKDKNFFDIYNLKRGEVENFKKSYLKIMERSKKIHDGIDNRLINSLNPLIGQVIENSKTFEIKQ
jgi:hypothetical protein